CRHGLKTVPYTLLRIHYRRRARSSDRASQFTYSSTTSSCRGRPFSCPAPPCRPSPSASSSSARTASTGDSLPPASVDQLMVPAFLWRHRVDDGFYAIQLRVVDLLAIGGKFLHRPHPGQHPDDLLERPHL